MYDAIVVGARTVAAERFRLAPAVMNSGVQRRCL
jgi:hypothetical protein